MHPIYEKPDFVDVNDVKLAVYRHGPDHRETDKPAIVFLHGFPELAYSWRAQMQAFGDAGYPVFAPDQRGYGKSDKPEGVENYTMAHLTGDIEGLLDHYGIEQAVFVGHDWGAIILWSLPLYMNDRILGLAGLNVAHVAHYRDDPIKLFEGRFGPDMYIVRFQKEGACEPILEANVRDTVRFFMRVPGGDRDLEKKPSKQTESLDMLGMLQKGEEHWGGNLLLDDAEMQIYIDAFEQGGYTAPLHWYRNMPGNWQAEKKYLKDGVLPVIEKPSLMITADMDRACPPYLAKGMEERVKPLTLVELKGCGHWSQQQMPDAVNKAVAGWLDEYFSE
jgi:pimeloyl-ACP methyl ester carboxylesterase